MARLTSKTPPLENNQSNTITRLIEYGKKKTHVTYDDILRFFPEAEHDMDQLEEAYTALLNAGINYSDEPQAQDEPDDEELDEAIVEEENAPSDDLANIDTDDTIGLYLKEVSRVPLLSNIEDLQVVYGISTDSLPSVNQYVELPADWNQVVSARVCVLARSEKTNIASAGNYLDCNGNSVAIPADRRLRKAFTATFNLRNRIHTPL